MRGSISTGIADFAKSLAELGYEIISTGGTESYLKENGLTVINISEITGFPECLDGRVKTLHPAIHGGLLARRSVKAHMDQLDELKINTIDIVAVNLYPFRETILKEPKVSFHEAIEKIDIGGPSMIRSAAKNYEDVAVVVNPADYTVVIDELKAHGEVTRETKLRLSAKVFEHTAAYDALIANHLREAAGGDLFPEDLTITYKRDEKLRYGENPHQEGVFYKETGRFPQTIAGFEQLHGKKLSFLNINDASGAIDIIKEFGDKPTAVAVKHANPCGVGTGATITEAFQNAYDADPVSIFGGIIALNRELDTKTAKLMWKILREAKIFLEIIIAPDFSEEALEILKKKENLRLLKLPKIAEPYPSGLTDFKKVPGGLLVQDFNLKSVDDTDVKVVTKTSPTLEQLKSLVFAMKVCKQTKSNAIVLAKGDATVGIGPGQTNRITALELAIKYAGEKAAGSVMASDAFFPMPDCVEAAHREGITAIIQPGGSIRDQDSIDKCDEYGIAMVFTGVRHFKH
ncbi:bifunctional purine biosynthesis protein PurH [Clostridia bacterium]|nr:bifunctional purine biosynthesis protein PurH [Clostridia bacterium]